MKDLKHYFNSPTESDHKSTKSSEHSQLEEDKKEKSVKVKEPAAKKRKIVLKNNKVKADPVNSKNEKPAENQLESSLDEVFEPTSNNKKRKRHKDKKPKLKKLKDSKKCADDVSEKSTTKDDNKPNGAIIKDQPSNNVVNLQSENSTSCDEVIVKSNMKRKSRILEESDEEVTSANKLPLTVEDKTENGTQDEKTPVNSSRNSLFSYFNKVDKETVLKQQSIKIKVEAIVHVPEPGTKVGRKSLEKFTPVSKQTKRKNQLLLENSDTIEVISSEEIDENSSNSVNIQMSPKPQINIEADIKTSVDEPIVIAETKVKNLASIFVQKKKEKPVSPILETTQLSPENKVSEIDKKVDKSKKKGSLKLKKATKDKNSPSSQKKEIPSKKEEPSKAEKESESLSSDNLNKVQITADSPKLQSKLCTPSRSNLNKTSNAELAKESQPKDETKIKTPDTTKECNQEHKNSTPKCKTLNGYFIPKSAKKDLEVSEESSNKKSSPGWVMKVRFGASRPLPDSDEDSRSSTKENPVAAKTTDNVQDEGLNGTRLDVQCENELSSDVVVIDDTGDNSSSRDIPSKKKEKNAPKVFAVSSEKRPRRSCVDENPGDVEVDDSEDISSSRETPCKKKEKGAKKQIVFSNEKRPRRSCTERKSEVIDIDDENSSEIEEKTSKRKLVSKNMKKSTLSPAVNKKEERTESPKPPVKMWPFFNKSAQKTKEAPVDEAKLKAKQLFLESGIPEVIKRKVDSVKCDVVLGSPAPFPTVSHVTQAADVEPLVCARLPTHRPDSPPPLTPAWSQLVSTAQAEEPEIQVFQRPKNVKTFLNQLKEEEPKTEVKVMYKRLKEYKSKAESDIWTEVYKPSQAGDMVGNSESLKKLKSWLEALKNRRKREGSESSGDEFVTEEDSNEDNSYNNMAVISGPCGCGKTSAVYAVANELDCKVLEINASCNRAGKKILAEFSESTQSHQVERSQVNGLFNNQHSGKSKKRKKSKVTEPKSEKTSLILVEDADLLFTDVDEGFMSSLSSLAATTKRPLILVTNQTHNPHLERFHNSRLLKLTFNRPKPNKLALWLRLVGLVEGVEMSPTEAESLVTWANCDVRKCLLQLQLMVHSNNSEIKEALSGGDLWWHWPAKHRLSFELPSLHEPDEPAEQTTQDKDWVRRQLASVAQTTSQLAYLDLLSTYRQTHCRDDEPCPVAWRSVCRDSTTLTECTVQHEHDNTTSELTHWLTQAMDVETSQRSGLSSSETRWQSILRQGEQFYLAGISTSCHTSHAAVTCDYLPALRDLGRTEKLRLATYTRRANRFFHYLQGLNIHASQSFRDFMSDVFS